MVKVTVDRVLNARAVSGQPVRYNLHTYFPCTSYMDMDMVTRTWHMAHAHVLVVLLAPTPTAYRYTATHMA